MVERASRGAPVRWPAGDTAERERRYGDQAMFSGLAPDLVHNELVRCLPNEV